MASLSSYLEELQDYVSGEKIEKAMVGILTVLLWRGTHPITVFGREFRLPLHSLVAFTWGVLVTNNYNRFPSFVVFAIAWLLLVSMEQHRQHPSPWHQCESYAALFRALIAEVASLCLGDSAPRILARQTETIAANQNLEHIQLYLEEQQRLKDTAAEVKLKQATELEEEVKRHEAEMAVASADTVDTVKKGAVGFFTSVNPLVPILHPVQNLLHTLCLKMRVVKSIVSWDENYFPFWIVTACLIVSVILFWIPWGWIMRWLIRIIVWVLLGPWMKIVDRYRFEQIEHMTPEEKEAYIQARARNAHKNLQGQRLLSRTMREDAVKLKSMMKYLFGKVS